MMGEIVTFDGTPTLQRNWPRLLGVRSIEDFRSARLVSAGEVHAVRRELDQLLQPAGDDRARAVAAILVAAYPHAKPHEPAIYSRLLRETLADYPRAVIERAAQKITRGNKFLPSIAEVCEACEAVKRELEWARFLIDQTQAEHARRAFEAAERERLALDRIEFLKRHGGKSPLDVLQLQRAQQQRVENGKENSGSPGAPGTGDPGGHGKHGRGHKGRGSPRRSENLDRGGRG